MFLTVAEVTELTDHDRNYVLYLARESKIATSRRLQKPGGKRMLWLLDQDEVLAYLKAHPRESVLYRPEAWSPTYQPAEPGHMTAIQASALANEDWHELTDIQPLDTGALHVKWSDGESFILQPNGDTNHYAYENEGQNAWN